MRARKWLLTSVMCGGLVLAGGIGNEAAALSGKVLQPNSDWAVSKLAAAQTGGQPYCALARRFNNNLILTMARNGQDETSVAIDFQKQTLNNSQSYLITLKPGFGQERSFNVRPVSGKALVIRMGQDYAFHDALNRSGQLDVDISGESYAFNLTDYSAGQHKLGECLAGLVEPAAGPDMMTPVPATPVHRSPLIPASASANDTVQPVNRSPAPAAPVVSAPPVVQDDAQLQALREENLRLRNALERERRNYEDRYMREGQTSSLVAELSEKVNILQMENKQLHDQLSYKPATEACAAAEPEMLDWSTDPALDQELSALKTENVDMKAELAALQAKNAMLEKQIAGKPEVDPAAVAAVESLRERVSRLEAENEKLKATNASFAKGGSDVPVSLAQLRVVEEQLRNVQRDRDSLLAQIKAMNEGKSKGLMDISTDNWNLEQATSRFNEAEKEIRRLGRELEEQRMQCSMDKKELEYMLFDPSVATKEQIARLTKLEDTVKEAKAVLDDQKSAYEQKLAALSSKAESATTTLDVQRAEYEQKVAVLKGELKNREQEMAQSRERLAKLESELAAQTRMASADTDKEVLALKQELQKSETSRALLAAQKTEYEQKLFALEQQIVTNRELSDSSHQRIAALEKELTAARQAAAAKVPAGSFQSVQLERDEIARQKEAFEAENHKLNDRIAALQDELSRVRVAAAAEPQNPATDAKIASLVEENNELVHQRNLLEQERNKLSDEAHRLNQKIASLEDSLSDIQTASGGPAATMAVEKATPAGRPAPVAAEPIGKGRAEEQPEIYAYSEFDQSVNQNVSVAAPSVTMINASALQVVLEQAQVQVRGAIQRDGVSGQDFVAFNWNTDSLYGSAEQQIMAGAGQFDSMVSGYLEKTRARCQGDFAAVPATSDQNGSMRVSSYEIACVSGQGGASASVVFFNDGVKFTAIAHETGLDNMAAAMDVRDSLFSSLLHTQVASR